MILSTFCSANDLIVSRNIKIVYEEPLMMSHSMNSLIFKYGGWYFSHSVVNPETMYSNIDLTGVENEFIKSLFDSDIRKKFPMWLSSLSEEQSISLGVSNNNVIEKTIGEVKLYAAYNLSDGMGHVFLIEENIAHHLTIVGSELQYKKLITWLKERQVI